jgi:hypothetical protein
MATNVAGWDEPDDEETVLRELLVPMAQTRLSAQLDDVTALDTKALGALALDAGAIGVLIGVHSTVNHLWWIPAAAAGVAGLLMLAAIRPEEFRHGVPLDEFYGGMSGSSPLEAYRQMLSELLECRFQNDRPRARKIQLFTLGFVLMVLALIGSVPIALLHE